MTSRWVWAGLAGVAILFAALALAAASDTALAIASALLATGAAALAAGLALADRLRWRRPEPAVLEMDRSVRFRDALRGGTFGRQSAIVELRSLERRYPEVLPPISPDEEARLLALPRREFLRWLSDRIDSLEERS